MLDCSETVRPVATGAQRRYNFSQRPAVSRSPSDSPLGAGRSSFFCPIGETRGIPFRSGAYTDACVMTRGATLRDSQRPSSALPSS